MSEEEERRVGVATATLVVVLVAVIAVAGVAAYLVLTPSGTSTSTQSASTTSASAAQPDVTVAAVPPSPLISPGETQNYSLIKVSPEGSGSGGALSITVFSPSGLSFVLNQTSVSLSGGAQSIPVVLKADPGLAPGNYSVVLETSSSAIPAKNQTVSVDVVPMLVLMQYPSFYPQNVTVTKGTEVTWINLNSYIGCCDPGEHDVSFLSGGNYTSRLISTLQTVSYTFGADGAYEYYCTIHPIMKGQVTVTG